MAGKIGFLASMSDERTEKGKSTAAYRTNAPRPSLVQVAFPGRGGTLAYYNDRFDLQPGDRVYVEGKLEGIQGRVTGVCYNFKIRPSDYKRVIFLVDTVVHGKFDCAGSHFVSFDADAIPYEKVLTWFRAPGNGEAYISGSDDSGFPLDDLSAMGIKREIAERGYDYYMENRVRYLCVEDGIGKAIVTGTEPYEVEFMLRDGEISSLTCSCFCPYPCKHMFAAMLQLKEIIGFVTEKHAEAYAQSAFFAAIERETLLQFALDGSSGRSISL